MLEPAEVVCPYCAESVEILLDPETEGVLIQDCEVCCRPWQLEVSWDEAGAPILSVEPAG